MKLKIILLRLYEKFTLKKIYNDIKYANSLSNTPQYVNFIATKKDVNEIIICAGLGSDLIIRFEKDSFIKALEENTEIISSILK